MADLNNTIQIIIGAVDETAGAFRTAIGNVEDFSGSLETATQPLADLTKGILAADAAAAAVAITFGAVAVNASNEFEDSLYLVKKQLDDTGPSITQAREDIEALALQYGINANEVARSSAGFLAAGYDYETSAKLIESSTQLMIAGELEAKTATDAIINSLAGFRVPADEAADASTRVGDVLNKIGDISSGSFDAIVDGFVRLAPTAQTAGLSMEQAAAAIATIVDTGRSGEEAATALKSGLLSLIAPSSAAADELTRLGVATTDNNGELLSANQILENLSVEYNQLTDSQKLQTAAVIFGKEQAGSMNSLLSDWGKNQDYVAQMLDETTGAVGSMAREVEGKLGLMSTSIDRTKEAWRQFAVAFGDEIKAGDDLQRLIDSIGRLGQALKDAVNSGDLDPLFEPVKAAFRGLESVVAEVAENLPAALEMIDWSRFRESVASLGGAFDGLFDGIDLTAPEGLADAIQLVIDALSGMIEVTGGIVEGLTPLFRIIGSLVEGFAALPSEVQSAAGVLLGLSTTVNTVSGVVGSFTGVLGGVGGAGGLVGSFAKLGPAIAAASVALAAFELGRYIGEVTGFRDATEEWLLSLKGIPPVIGASDEAMTRSGGTLRSLATELGVSSLSMAEFNDAVESGKLVWSETAQAWVAAGDSAKDLGASFDAIGTSELIDEFNALNPALRLNADGTVKAAEAAGEMVYINGQLVRATQDATGKWIELKDATEDGAANIEAAGEDMKLAAEKTELMTRASADFILGWEEIQSAERIAIFEARADIQVAQIEADAERTVAAFTSMADSFRSTGEVLTELFGIWAGLDSSFDRAKVEDWIKREFEIREKLADGQLKLLEAEVKRMEAQTAMLERGGVEIAIKSDGLEPALEAFMFSVIDKVRIQIAGSYEDFLLGCGS